MPTFTNVGCKFVNGNLIFFSKLTGQTLAVMDTVEEVVGFGGHTLANSGTTTDIDAQNGTLTAAAILGGTVVHTSRTAAGTLTLDTGANIAAGIPELNSAGNDILVVVTNDGDQTVTLASATGATVCATVLDGDDITVPSGETITLVVVSTGAEAFDIRKIPGS